MRGLHLLRHSCTGRDFALIPNARISDAGCLVAYEREKLSPLPSSGRSVVYRKPLS
jgi:hypothetical protein